MNFKNLCPEDIIKISSSISLLLINEFDTVELAIIKNILNAITCNIGCYQTQEILHKNKK